MTSATPVAVRPLAWDHPDGVRLRTAQQDEIRALYGADDTEPGAAPSAADVALFLIAADPDGTPVGCGALRLLGPDAAEVKRMFVVPERRGGGVADAVLTGLEDAARERGLRVLRLETGPQQVAAIRFYERRGYSAIPAFGAYAGHPDSLCYERVL